LIKTKNIFIYWLLLKNARELHSDADWHRKVYK